MEQVQPKEVSIPGVRLIRRLGKGGFGVVYYGIQDGLERPVAVKVMSLHLSRDPAYVQRFLREARTAAQISHENLTGAMTAGESQGYYYLIMEYVDGSPLSEILKQRGALPISQALSLTRQVARALAYAHEKGFVHRDVKPANVLVKPDGTAKLCDLGLAREMEADMNLTQAGAALGTPKYMSPEQARGEPQIDGRADLYSLGIMLYELLAGKPPFVGDNAFIVVSQQLNTPVPDVRKIRPDAPAGISAVIDKLTQKKAEDRYPTAEALLRDLDALVTGRPGSASYRPVKRRSTARMPKIQEPETLAKEEKEPDEKIVPVDPNWGKAGLARKGLSLGVGVLAAAGCAYGWWRLALSVVADPELCSQVDYWMVGVSLCIVGIIPSFFMLACLIRKRTYGMPFWAFLISVLTLAGAVGLFVHYDDKECTQARTLVQKSPLAPEPSGKVTFEEHWLKASDDTRMEWALHAQLYAPAAVAPILAFLIVALFRGSPQPSIRRTDKPEVPN